MEALLPSLDEALASIRKDFGKGAIMRLGENTQMDVETFSTGSLKLDLALGVGGLPLGRVTEIFGPESSGKTTLATHVIASAQKSGKICAYIDTEHAVDPKYAAALGVDVDALLMSQPEHAEEAMEIMRRLIQSGEVGCIVIDSVAALVPRAELDGEIGDAHVGRLARLMSQTLRMVVGDAAKNGTSLIFINQIREKIGVMFGSPETTPGGRALKFYSSVRLDVRRKETKKSDGEAVSNLTRVKVVKNKVASPFKEAEFEIVFGEGICFALEVLDVGVELGIVSKSGGWHEYGGWKINGRDAVKQHLQEDEVALDALYKEVWAAMNNGEIRE
jgi:recombination protein RecA